MCGAVMRSVLGFFRVVLAYCSRNRVAPRGKGSRADRHTTFPAMAIERRVSLERRIRGVAIGYMVPRSDASVQTSRSSSDIIHPPSLMAACRELADDHSETHSPFGGGSLHRPQLTCFSRQLPLDMDLSSTRSVQNKGHHVHAFKATRYTDSASAGGGPPSLPSLTRAINTATAFLSPALSSSVAYALPAQRILHAGSTR